MKGIRRYVENLLKGRRPRPFAMDDADADALRVAIELRAARPGSDAPREEFVTDLHRRLAQTETERPPMPLRRGLLLGGGTLVAGAAAGATVESALTPDTTPQGGGVVTPDNGRWHPVVNTADLPEGGTRPFDAGGISGFVTREGGRLRAVSGVCTHQGCRLNLEAGTRLRCPCHQALFALDGTVLHHRYPRPLPALPRLAVRETNGVIQVFVSG
jgi:cytochrome b6-f complex iron-sulfur subunit